MKALFTTLLIAACQALAGETALVASLGSYHFDRDSRHCELNPGVGVELGLARDTALHSGSYEGSNCERIAYLGVSWMGVKLAGAARAGAGLFAFLGYDEERGRVRLAPLPALHLPLDARRGLNFALAPTRHGMVGVQLRMVLR